MTPNKECKCTPYGCICTNSISHEAPEYEEFEKVILPLYSQAEASFAENLHFDLRKLLKEGFISKSHIRQTGEQLKNECKSAKPASETEEIDERAYLAGVSDLLFKLLNE